ncbi:MAG: hypothetical protein ACKVIO_00270 [Phycisphaerales bacterium]|jgi:hypothetical protein
MNNDPKQISPIAESISDMQVALSLQCARCGYELRELAADCDCPECGEPIRLTIIEVIDPSSRRLKPIHNPTLTGNSIAGVVLFFFFAVILSVIAILSNSPDSLPIPDMVYAIPSSILVWGSAILSIIAIAFLVPIMKICQLNQLARCRKGVVLTFFGLWFWAFSMVAIALMILSGSAKSTGVTMLLDTCIPVIAAGVVFTGFKHLIPRLGQRCRAFRQAQGSRQRMDDLLAALVVVIVGRTLLAVSPLDSNLFLLGLIIMVMSISLIVIGLGYLLRDTIWIRNALVTPPPALESLLRQIN